MDYLATLNEKQRIAIELAKQQLKSSYTMEKSNGYLKSTRPVVSPPSVPPPAAP
jgi:hypothetical protein